MLSGLGCRGGPTASAIFGVAALFPGLYVPTATMGTQGDTGPIGFITMTVGVPAFTYFVTRMIGGFALFRSWRSGLTVGVVLGPGVAWIVPQLNEVSRLPVSWVVWGLPWLTGSLGARRTTRKRQG